MSNVLIVDDEPAICWAFQQALQDEGHDVYSAASAEQAIDLTDRFVPDVVVLDVRLPGMDGIAAMRQLSLRLDSTPIIIMTAFGSLETAVAALGEGAFEYLPKPFDLQQAISVVARALESKSIEPSARPAICESASKPRLIGSTPIMQTLYRKIALVANRDVPVLITGESGTGKDVIARSIHDSSEGCSRPFVPICVPALSPTLVESELFGHVRGAFTGADTDRQGLLDLASPGTAFLDEIGDIPFPAQVKLLRALETRSICPVGSGTWRSANFRLIAATNRNIDALVDDGEFREDLFYRLNVFRIEVPPLRQRREDIPDLVRHFLESHESGPHLEISPDAMDNLVGRSWFGNVRELRNAIEHAAINARSGIIRTQDLPPAVEYKARSSHALRTTPDAGRIQPVLLNAVENWLKHQLSDSPLDEVTDLYGRFLAECEPTILRFVLGATQGNRLAAARILGMHRQTLREKLRRITE